MSEGSSRRDLLVGAAAAGASLLTTALASPDPHAAKPRPATPKDPTMPQAVPGSLRPDEVYSLVAYVLFLNGLVPKDVVLDARTLPTVVMPARDRFVTDDRRGGPELR